MPRKGHGRRGEVTAKEMAEMGFCEKRIQLARLYGEQVTHEQQKDRARGQLAHQRYLEDGLSSRGDRRCFVATCVFGQDALETQVLRQYRDAVLLRCRLGRWIVGLYYRTSPSLCAHLVRSAAAMDATRRLLRVVVAGCLLHIARRDEQ